MVESVFVRRVGNVPLDRGRQLDEDECGDRESGVTPGPRMHVRVLLLPRADTECSPEPAGSVRMPPPGLHRDRSPGANRHAAVDRICRSPVGSSRRDDPIPSHQCHGSEGRSEARARHLRGCQSGRSRHPRRARRERPRRVRGGGRGAIPAGLACPHRGSGALLRDGQLLGDLSRPPDTARRRAAGDRLAHRRCGEERIHPRDRRAGPALRIDRRRYVDARRRGGLESARRAGMACRVARGGHRCRRGPRRVGGDFAPTRGDASAADRRRGAPRRRISRGGRPDAACGREPRASHPSLQRQARGPCGVRSAAHRRRDRRLRGRWRHRRRKRTVGLLARRRIEPYRRRRPPRTPRPARQRPGPRDDRLGVERPARCAGDMPLASTRRSTSTRTTSTTAAGRWRSSGRCPRALARPPAR